MTTPIVPIIFGGLIAWSIYRRVRRNIGRQPLRPVRSTISIIIFSLVSLSMLAVSFMIPKLLLGIVGGLFLGISLGFLGLKLTKFETTPEGHFYTPDTRIGIALMLLFVGRLLYRFWILNDVVAATGHPPRFQSALTFLTFGLIAGYYIVYHVGILIHKRDKPAPLHMTAS